MVNRKFLLQVSACAALAFGSFYATGFFKTRVMVVHAQNTLSPMLVNYVNRFPAGGQMKSFAAVRSNGDSVEGKFLLRPDGNEYLMRGLTLPSVGKAVTVMEDIKAINTTRLNGGLNHDDPATSCTTPVIGKLAFTKSVVGTDTILNQPVVHVQWQISDEVVDRWQAPQFGCFILRDILTRKGTLVVDKQAISITAGEPDPSLFTVPADYTEMKPSSADSVFAAKFLDGNSPECIRQTQAKRDANYNQSALH